MTAKIAVAVARLAELECVIERGLGGFFEAGQALTEIRNERLYKATHRTFDAYCKEKWRWSRVQAHRMIGAAAIVKLLPIGNKPSSESVARELSAVEPEAVVEVWERVQEEYGERPTAKQARETVRRITPRELTPAEELQREMMTATVRLRDWRARFGHLRPLRDVIRFIDSWLEEQK